MKKDSFHKGLDKIREFTSTSNKDIPTHLKILDDFQDIAPDLGNLIIEFAYGDIYSRPGLTNQQRTLITVSSLVTQGTEPQLELHINAALTVGITPTEVVETIIHLIPYTGFPRIINALTVAKKVFSQRHVHVSPSQHSQ
ncbi:carboxymuconolactone decarboxylase family protein [Bacillus toyonensis]|uniref:carboxymuconolactone decarboxylase family protein n=1 Tax=Bacillus toyonensis TaxID=155322 RepID=UPI000BF0D2A6|nr:carboxymuconolactone decarboxylase family protein [Bacillus toyonensis]PEK73167.1 4-carboxymuconolactone decarboxylase [Bacillus toyonensis]PEO39784.1 4-carboxymuconolactone decarboxylase [Bacillus toyonensis]PFY30453.1 4-carboxymuconolactone decarboxylase [Bacillus toyonensis]PFY44275.1 4-carboxymuconolactone decarboxylase [Bacillus toyonensis]PFY81513.1 4-carboxymuconolactone decarboxylase [Bacillus toyonensis]